MPQESCLGSPPSGKGSGGRPSADQEIGPSAKVPSSATATQSSSVVSDDQLQKLEHGKERELVDAFGWINLAMLVIVLVGYAYHKGTYNPFKALWNDLTKPR